LLVAYLCLSCFMLLAQRDDVFYKTADTTDVNDSIPPFKKACYGFYFMPAETFNRGVQIPPLPNVTLPGGPSSGSIYYSGNAIEKPAFSFSFGAEYESKTYFKRLFFSVGLEFMDSRYTGNATLAIVSPSYGINTSESVPYSWSAITINLPVELHFAVIKQARYRFDLLLGVAPALFLSQTYANQSDPTYDSFKPFTYWALFGLGFEYYLGNSFIFRAQPQADLLETKTPQGRVLETFGIELGLVFK